MLIDVFREFQKHHLMAQIKQYYGPESSRGATSYPHIEWIPTSDVWDPPLWVNQDAIIDGKQIQIEACFSRACGVTLRLYEKDYEPLEQLINRVVNALYDVLVSTANFTMKASAMMNRDQISENTVGYEMNLSIRVPIYRLLPVAILETIEESVAVSP